MVFNEEYFRANSVLTNRRTNPFDEKDILLPGESYFAYLRHQARHLNGCGKSYICIDETTCVTGAVNAPLIFTDSANALRIKFTLGQDIADGSCVFWIAQIHKPDSNCHNLYLEKKLIENA